MTDVVTDTTAYLPDELIAEHGIHRVSLYVAPMVSYNCGLDMSLPPWPSPSTRRT